MEDFHVLHHTSSFYNEFILLFIYLYIQISVYVDNFLIFYLQYLFYVSSLVQFYTFSSILSRVYTSSPAFFPSLLYPCPFYSITLIFLPCLSFLSFVQQCFRISWFVFYLGSILPPIVSTLAIPLPSRRIQGQRGSFWAVQPVRAPSLVKLHFLSPPRSAPAAAPGKYKASYEQKAQGQLLILKMVLICLCLISLMLMLAASRLLTKLSDFLFNSACGLSALKMKLTVQATFP